LQYWAETERLTPQTSHWSLPLKTCTKINSAVSWVRISNPYYNHSDLLNYERCG
jgi:hypothetical protein